MAQILMKIDLKMKKDKDKILFFILHLTIETNFLNL